MRPLGEMTQKDKGAPQKGLLLDIMKFAVYADGLSEEGALRPTENSVGAACLWAACDVG